MGSLQGLFIYLLACILRLKYIAKCGGCVQLLSSAHGSGEGFRSSSIACQHLYRVYVRKRCDQSSCGASIVNNRVTDVIFADLEVLVIAFEAPPSEPAVSWVKIKVYAFKVYWMKQLILLLHVASGTKS